MKVNGDQTAIQLDAYLKKVQTRKVQQYQNQTSSAAQPQSDQVELSDKAKAMQQATQELSSSESAHAERVKQVQMDIESGTYKVVGTKVATDMLKETFQNNAILNKIDTHA